MASSQELRIQQMESQLDAAMVALKQVNAALDALDAARDGFAEIVDYYGSDAWDEDRRADDAGHITASLKRGILTEDLPYDLIGQWRLAGIRLLEAGTASVKQL